MGYGWLIYTKSTLNGKFKDNAFDWFRETALKYDIHLKIFFKEDLSIENGDVLKIKNNNVEIALPDFVFMRTSDLVLSTQLNLLNIPIFNDYSNMQQAKNKLITSQKLRAANITTPNFFYTNNHNYVQISDFFNNESFVMKDNEGSQGEGVYLIQNEDEFLQALNLLSGEIMYQEFIGTSYGKDIRVYLLGNKIVGAIKRLSKDGFKSNYSLGGSAISCELDTKLIELATKASFVSGLDFCGLDVLLLEDGYTICEINGSAGFRAISSVTDVDIVDEICKYINVKIYKK